MEYLKVIYPGKARVVVIRVEKLEEMRIPMPASAACTIKLRALTPAGLRLFFFALDAYMAHRIQWLESL